MTYWNQPTNQPYKRALGLLSVAHGLLSVAHDILEPTYKRVVCLLSVAHSPTHGGLYPPLLPCRTRARRIPTERQTDVELRCYFSLIQTKNNKVQNWKVSIPVGPAVFRLRTIRLHGERCSVHRTVKASTVRAPRAGKGEHDHA